MSSRTAGVEETHLVHRSASSCSAFLLSGSQRASRDWEGRTRKKEAQPLLGVGIEAAAEVVEERLEDWLERLEDSLALEEDRELSVGDGELVRWGWRRAYCWLIRLLRSEGSA